MLEAVTRPAASKTGCSGRVAPTPTPSRVVSGATRLLCWLSAVGTIGTACGDQTETEITPVIQFDSGAVSIATASDTVRMRLEIADSDSERGYGLMDRSVLDPNSGMLFLYDAPQDAASGFYMFRTRVPLDIAFIDSVGVIRNIMAMTPCERDQPEFCTTYIPGIRYIAALEVNQGFFEKRGVRPGAQVSWTR
jgi:uncharacterized membrane protein (UPF0127 family)